MVETVTTTSIADLPDWQKTYMKEILDRAQALGKDNYTLPAYNVAERTPLQQQATQLAQQGVGSYAPMLQGAAGSVGTGIAATQAGLNPLAQSITSAGQIGSTTAANILNPNAAQAYMNPYEQAVIDQTMQDIQRQSNIQQQGLDAQSVGADAFGGSRQGIQRAEQQRNTIDAQARAAAGLRQSGYNQAQQQQLTRAQAAGQAGMAGAQLMQSGAAQYGQLGQGIGSLGMNQAKLGEAFQGLNLNDINTLSSFGGQEQGQQQAVLDAQRQTQYQNTMQPYQQLGFYSDIFQGMPTSQSTFTSQQQPSASPVSQFAGLAGGLYSLGKSGMFG
jgi:hypothetical protein|tara:strand:+ start:1438 stop:2430 length:993 start_codon:yes stop_codon:yes gene_type:complete